MAPEILPEKPLPKALHAFLAQRITPDVQTGCISCCSGDGKFGGPIWWNTPMDDEAAEEEAANRAMWAAGSAAEPPPSRKRPAEEEEIDDEVGRNQGGGRERFLQRRGMGCTGNNGAETGGVLALGDYFPFLKTSPSTSAGQEKACSPQGLRGGGASSGERALDVPIPRSHQQRPLGCFPRACRYIRLEGRGEVMGHENI